jgi:hypothetical protein
MTSLFYLLVCSNILLLLNREMVGKHPQYPVLVSFCDNKHRARVITDERLVSVNNYVYVFY